MAPGMFVATPPAIRTVPSSSSCPPMSMRCLNIGSAIVNDLADRIVDLALVGDNPGTREIVAACQQHAAVAQLGPDLGEMRKIRWADGRETVIGRIVNFREVRGRGRAQPDRATRDQHGAIVEQRHAVRGARYGHVANDREQARARIIALTRLERHLSARTGTVATTAEQDAPVGHQCLGLAATSDVQKARRAPGISGRIVDLCRVQHLAEKRMCREEMRRRDPCVRRRPGPVRPAVSWQCDSTV